jgi:hypothetical protein
MSGSDSFPPVDGPHSKFALIPDRILFSHPEYCFLASLKSPDSLQSITVKLKAAGLWFKLPSRLNLEVKAPEVPSWPCRNQDLNLYLSEFCPRFAKSLN